MQHPKEEVVANWNGAGLANELWQWTFDRLLNVGFGSLNHTEQVIHVLMHFDGEFNNGGCGQWLYQTSGEQLRMTPELLREIDSPCMAEFVEEVFEEAGEAITEEDEELRMRNIAMLPRSFHRRIEDLTGRFLGLETQFLNSLDEFARTHWREVRVA